MKYHIDISVFSPDHAVGMLSGPFEFLQPPAPGGMVKLVPDKPLHPLPKVEGFSWRLAIETLVKFESPPGTGVMMEDLCVSSHAEAVAVMTYMEQEHGLFLDYWEETPDTTSLR